LDPADTFDRCVASIASPPLGITTERRCYRIAFTKPVPIVNAARISPTLPAPTCSPRSCLRHWPIPVKTVIWHR